MYHQESSNALQKIESYYNTLMRSSLKNNHRRLYPQAGWRTTNNHRRLSPQSWWRATSNQRRFYPQSGWSPSSRIPQCSDNTMRCRFTSSLVTRMYPTQLWNNLWSKKACLEQPVFLPTHQTSSWRLVSKKALTLSSLTQDFRNTLPTFPGRSSEALKKHT